MCVCVSQRPRALGAKWTSEKIAPDEYVPRGQKLNWEGKRDRWHGADLAEHQTQVSEEFQRAEEVCHVVSISTLLATPLLLL